MSSRAMVQIPEELKTKVEELKETFFAKTNYEVIEKLVAYYERGERQKIEDRQKREAEKQYQQEEMIYVGADLKKKYLEFGQSLSFKSESTPLVFLLEHFKNSPSIDKRTLNFLAKHLW